jgi:hypothetical protein
MKNTKSYSGKKLQPKKSHQSEPQDSPCEPRMHVKGRKPLRSDPNELADADWSALPKNVVATCKSIFRKFRPITLERQLYCNPRSTI